ncbi:predicted protein [Nematostella vectensis]|uniref:Cilia- and flagella-associated protein 57 n=1 Tax=Nematostella vectensis TaxID=45351 RepID=A7SJM7_NEMVE|nr:predicted protein [Nematostella vectensis]|eukprot:XP_001628131.1 predicted protein [Nematostella vectensis]
MSIAVATPRHCFGLKADKSQRFIPGSDKSVGMTAMAVSPNRRYVAIAEKGEKATITIYDLHTLRKKKVLSHPEVQSAEFVSLAFSPDSKYLVSQSGRPDWTLLYWTWEKAKVMAFTKSSNQQDSAVYQVSFNPQDNTQLCVVGNGIFKLFRYSEGNLKQFAFQKMEPQNFLCHAWVSDERIITGTDTGRLLLFESGELKNEFSVFGGGPSAPGTARQLSTAAIGADPSPTQTAYPQVTCIAAFSKGFICSGGAGTVHLFEKAEEKDAYKKSREIRIPTDTTNPDPQMIESQEIKDLTVSPSEETLVCSTSTSQLYSITLSTADLGKGDLATFELLSQSFHHGVITGMDVCIRKPLIATCSLDRSVRIWNYETCSLEAYKEFQEECYSIALHPSGLYILVGFSDKLRLMNLLIDDIRYFKEFTIRGCRECSFSNGGHLFAAVHGNVIQLYSSTTFENVGNLKGHNGKVRQVIWSQDDSKIISCGMDGAVYEWNVYNYKREGESVLKSCSYTSVTVSPDGRTTFAVGSDRTIKEICDSQILREVPASDMVLTQCVMSRSGRMLFAGTASGTLRAMKFPLTVPGEWQEHQVHAGSINKMRMSYDDQYLFTASEDGSLYIYKAVDKEGRGLKRDKEVGYAEEILITKSDLEEKNAMMAELKTRVEELKMENEYQLRLKDMNYNEKIKELTEKFIQEMESLKTKNQVLKTDKDKEEAKHEEEVADHMEKHSKELQDLESANNQKLMSEYEKYQELQAKSQKMQEDYERQLTEMEEAREQVLEELTEYYENKLQEKTAQLDQSQEESRQQLREYEETKKQIEEDADREILDIKNKYERRLREEKEANLRLKGETGIMRKKVRQGIPTIY